MADAIDPVMLSFASMYKQAEVEMVLAVDAIRKSGGRLSDYVVVVADPRDGHTKLFARDLGRKETDDLGWVAVVPKDTVARVLRLCNADASAIDAPLPPGMMRLLFARSAKVQFFDLAAFPVLPPTGDA